MSEADFLGATIETNRHKISQKDDHGIIVLSFPLIPNPPGSRATGEWVKLINSEWEKSKLGSGSVEFAQIQVTVDYDNVIFELPPFALSRLENAINRVEGILEIQNQVYAAQVKRNRGAQESKDATLNEILDRISKKKSNS